MKLNRVTIVIGVLLSAFALSALATGAELVRIANGHLQVGLDKAHGSLCELTQLSDGYNQLAEDQSPLGLWQITVRDGERLQELAADLVAAPTVEQLAGDPPGLRLVWNAVAPGGPEPLRVEVLVRFDPQNSSLSRWELAVTKPRHVQLEQVRFPRVASLRPRPDEVLAVPRQLGVLARNPRALVQGKDGKGARLNWRSPHGTDLSLPCLAFYQQDGPGFYAACDDSQGYLQGLRRLGRWERPTPLRDHARAGTSGGRADRVPAPLRGRAGRISRRLDHRGGNLPRVSCRQGLRRTRTAPPAAYARLGGRNRSLAVESRPVPAGAGAGPGAAKAGQSPGQRPLALVAQLPLRRRLPRIPAASRRHRAVQGRAGRRTASGRSRDPLHEPAPLGNDHPKLARRGSRSLCRQGQGGQGGDRVLQHLHEGPLRPDVHRHAILAPEVCRDRAGSALRSEARWHLHGSSWRAGQLLRPAPRPYPRAGPVLDRWLRGARNRHP